jgi:transcriptional regulator with XRE-family HTH domain
MPQRSTLTQAQPFAVESAIRKLGADLRTARLRRGLTIGDAASRIGTGVRAVADAEHGKPTTSVAVYAALLWLYDMQGRLADAADPLKDREGLRLQARREPKRARRARRGADNDF